MEAHILTSQPDTRQQLALFAGGTGGIDSWLIGDHANTVIARLDQLPNEPISRSQFNQLLALSHRADVSEGFFKYYWLSEPTHPYDVTRVPQYHPTYKAVHQILSLEQLYWGLYRIYVDCLLFFGSIRDGFRALRALTPGQLQDFFERERYDADAMLHRGPALPLESIAQDDRYLIAEQACKSMDAPAGGTSELLMLLKGAWEAHLRRGGGQATAKELLQSAHILNGFKQQQGLLDFAADALLDSEVRTEEELIERYQEIEHSFLRARKAALRNTELYLSMANDLDVYVATSMHRGAFSEDGADV